MVVMAAVMLDLKQGYHVQVFVFTSFLMLFYLVGVRPFTTPLLNVLEIINETIVLLTGYSLMLFSDGNKKPTFRTDIGYFYISVVSACILANWGVLVYKLV